MKYYTRNAKLFGFMNHHFYSDVQNNLIVEAYLEILRKCDRLPSNRALPCAEKLVKEFNDSHRKSLKKIGNRLGLTLKPFITLNVHVNKNGKKPFLFGYYPNKIAFLNFIDTISDSDKVTLYEKYKYIEQTKFYGEELTSATIFLLQPQNYTIAKNSMGRFHESFNTAIDTDKEFILNTLDGLLAFLKKKLDNTKKAYSTSSLLKFLPEIIVGIYTIRSLVENGYVSACYREMRSLTERLSWFILDDYLSANSFGYWKMKARGIPSMLLNVNPQWRKKNTEQLRWLGKLIPKGIQMNSELKSIISKELVTRMSIEMYITLFGEPTISIPKYKENIFIPYVEKTVIEEGIKEIGKCLGNIRLNNSADKRQVELFKSYVENKWEHYSYGVPKFPTTNFILQFLKSAFGGNDWEQLERIWNDYSLFIHPYIPTLQILPNFSMMEYKVLEHEIPTFESVIKLEMDSLSKYFQKLRREYDN
jgi:hypothetical protein